MRGEHAEVHERGGDGQISQGFGKEAKGQVLDVWGAAPPGAHQGDQKGARHRVPLPAGVLQTRCASTPQPQDGGGGGRSARGMQRCAVAILW